MPSDEETRAARDAFMKCSRILERLPTDETRRRVIRAFAVLLELAEGPK